MPAPKGVQLCQVGVLLLLQEASMCVAPPRMSTRAASASRSSGSTMTASPTFTLLTSMTTLVSSRGISWEQVWMELGKGEMAVVMHLVTPPHWRADPPYQVPLSGPLSDPLQCSRCRTGGHIGPWNSKYTCNEESVTPCLRMKVKLHILVAFDNKPARTKQERKRSDGYDDSIITARCTLLHFRTKFAYYPHPNFLD